MISKIFILLLLMLIPCFALDVEPTGLKSDFSVKCFGIMQPLLQDIAVKKQKIDQCDSTIQTKEDKLIDTQSKFNELQTKHAILEAVLKEKEQQIADQRELNIFQTNNTLVKDELLNSLRVQVSANAELIKIKSEQIEILLKEALEYKNELNTTKSRVETLETLEKSNQLQKQSSESQIQKLLAESKETKEKLESQKINLLSKTEQFEKLQAESQWNRVQFEELKTNFTVKQQEMETLQKDYQKLTEQLSSYKLQVENTDAQLQTKVATLQEKQSQIEHLQLDLTSANTKLSEYQSEIDKMHSTNCIWFGNSTDIHQIRAPGISPFNVLCDSKLAGSGWTVIQRRINGSLDFYRNWTDYRDGFGSLQGEFFIGMEKLYRLTIAQSYELYVHLETFGNETFYARYGDFSVGSEAEKYALKMLGTYSGNAGDGLFYARYRKFSTFDADNDRDEINCAEHRHGAWWYDRCGLSNLNGQYMTEQTRDMKGIFWYGAHAFSFKSVQMMMRPKSAAYNFKL